jgi:putative transport protein
MSEWLVELFTKTSIANTVLMYGIIISIGIWLGRIKIAGISLGVTWILFTGIIFSAIGVRVDESTNHFLKEFGLVLFVYLIGLQVGPGFFASLKKNAVNNNILASLIVFFGVAITVLLFYFVNHHIAIMAGIMSGAVTNTPGLAAAQAAISSVDLSPTEKSSITLAYAIAYPFGVFGIILSMLIIKKIFGVNINDEKELHRKLNVLKANKPVSQHFSLNNPMLFGLPLSKLFLMLKEKIIVSRMLHHGEIITPTPDTILAEGDILLIVASKKEIDQLQFIVGPLSDRDLKKSSESNLISRTIVVTKKSVTHKRLGDLPELFQHHFTMTRLNRAGFEMVPHGDIFLQLGDTIKVVGTEEDVHAAAEVLGNSIKLLEVPDLAPILIGIALGVILGSVPFHFPGMPVAVKVGMAGGPLIIALLLSKFGNKLYLTNYTTNSANLMMRELGIGLFLASVGLSSGGNLSGAFVNGDGLSWIIMSLAITIIPLVLIGVISKLFFRKTFFEICGLLAGASTDPPALAFATKMASSDIPSVTYATVYPLTMILRIVAAQLLILLFS